LGLGRYFLVLFTFVIILFVYVLFLVWFYFFALLVRIGLFILVGGGFLFELRRLRALFRGDGGLFRSGRFSFGFGVVIDLRDKQVLAVGTFQTLADHLVADAVFPLACRAADDNGHVPSLTVRLKNHLLVARTVPATWLL
jgi:hypothetical protein